MFGLFVEWLDYFSNGWIICRMFGLFVKCLGYLSNVWIICRMFGLFVNMSWKNIRGSEETYNTRLGFPEVNRSYRYNVKHYVRISSLSLKTARIPVYSKECRYTEAVILKRNILIPSDTLSHTQETHETTHIHSHYYRHTHNRDSKFRFSIFVIFF